MGILDRNFRSFLVRLLGVWKCCRPGVSPGISGGHFGAARMARAGPILTPIGVKSRIIPNWRHSRQESRIRLSRVGRHPPGGHATDTYGHGSDKPATATDTMDTTDSPDTTIGSSSSTDCGHLSRTGKPRPSLKCPTHGFKRIKKFLDDCLRVR